MIIVDIETSANVDINSGLYIKTAKVKWVGLYVYEEDKYYLLSHEEKDKIKELIKIYGGIMISYNGDNFDIPILKNNDYLPNGWNTSIDVMRIMKDKYDMLGQRILRFSLKNVAKQILGEDIKGEIDYDIFKKDKWNAQEEEEIKKYLKADIVATKRLYDWLENKLQGLKSFMSDYDQRHKKYLTLTSGSYVYSVICNETGMRKEFADGVVHKKYKGGFVAKPTGDKFVGNIYMMDFNSMYPHAYMMGNLFSGRCTCCAETYKWQANKLFPELKGRYCRKNRGEIENTIKKLYDLRLEYKKAEVYDPREYAIKIIINTMYGVCGNPVFKNLYNPVTAADCTYIARTCVKYARKQFRNAGYEIIYSDTDSVYLMDKYNDEERLMLVKDNIINDIKINMNFSQDTFDMGIDEKPKALFFFKMGTTYKKKHYVYITHDDKVVIKGLQIIKRNSSKLSNIIYKKYMVPDIIKNLDIVFDKLLVRKWILQELEEDISLAGYDMTVKNPSVYKLEGQIQRQVAMRYGKGVHFLIPNWRFGVGKGLKVCKIDELKKNKVSVKDIDLTGVYRDLEPFMNGKLSSGIIKKKVGRNEILQNTLELWV